MRIFSCFNLKHYCKCWYVVQERRLLPANCFEIFVSEHLKKPTVMKTVKVHMFIANNQFRLVEYGSDRRVSVTEYLLWFFMKSFRDFYRIFAIDWVITGYLGLVEGIFPHDICRFGLSELIVVSLDGLMKDTECTVRPLWAMYNY